MIQKQDRGLLPGLDLIVLIIVFILAIAFTGILLPSTRSIIDTQGQTNTSIPYTDISSDKSLQIKNIKFNSTSPSVPGQESETCEGTTQTPPNAPPPSAPGTTKAPVMCPVCHEGTCVMMQTAWTDPADCPSCEPSTCATSTTITLPPMTIPPAPPTTKAPGSLKNNYGAN